MSTPAFSKERLARVHTVLASHVERRALPGFVTALCRRDEVHFDAFGTQALDGPEPMRRDTIFRVSSMTKPVTAAAVMLLVEECVLRLDDPVDRFLPELANRRVLARIDAELDDTVPAKRPVTVRDLLTFRWGFGLPWGREGLPIQRAASETGVRTLGPPKPVIELAPDEWIRHLGALPLMYQPGERWAYNSGSHVLGVLVARASGRPFDVFLRERLFEPLGMKDTGFFVPAEKLGRFATSYIAQPATGALDPYDGVRESPWAAPPVFHDGAAGLVSTADDYLAFARMLLRNGAHGKHRVLSRASVSLMTNDHLTQAQKAPDSFAPGYWEAHGWGFGVAVTTRRDDLGDGVGSYGWDGGLGTAWRNDPAEDLVGILLTQRGDFPTASPVYLDFWASAYQALEG